MARKSRKSEAQRFIERQYAKAVRNFWAQAKSMVKRGYIVNTALPDKPKRITAGSVRAVQRQQKKLYAEAQYINQQTGEVLTGGQGRVTERKRSAEKARQARAVKQFGKSIRQLIDNLSAKRGNTQEGTDADKQWEKRKREEDEQDKERLRTDDVYRAGFDCGRVALQWLFGSIEEISRKYPNSGARLKAVVEQAISVKGEQGVGLAIASANDEALAVMQELDASAYSPEGARFTGALVTLNQILMGTSLSAEEMQVMQDATDADMYWDDLAEE